MNKDSVFNNLAIMDLEKWSDIVPTFIKIPYNLYKYRTLISKIWVKFMAFTNLGDTNIVVLGRPNVGKSVMVDFLLGVTKEINYALPDASSKVESEALTAGKFTKLIRTIPGQSSEERFNGLIEAFNTHSNLEGIIYTCNWGYTNERSDVMRKRRITEEGFGTIEEIRKFNLEKELEDYRLMCHEIEKAYSSNKNLKWLLLVVNKADLFSSDAELNEAQQYYDPEGAGPFAEVTNNLLGKIGRNNIKCAALPLCSYAESFAWNNEVKATNIGNDENRKALAKYLFKTISKFQ